MTAKARFGLRSRSEDQIAFVIRGKDQANVLLPVVALFEELKIEIEAMWMLRQKRTRNARISITVQADDQASRKVEARLSKIDGILSVKTGPAGTAVIQDPPDGRE